MLSTLLPCLDPCYINESLLIYVFECIIPFEIQGLSKRFRCRFDASRQGASLSVIGRRLSKIVDILSLTSFDIKVLKSTASKSWGKASSLKCLMSRKNLSSLLVGSVWAIVQNIGR